MILPDVNVLVYAHDEASPGHDAWREWWEGVVNGPAPFAMADVCLTGFVRVVTHPGILKKPLALDRALAAVHSITSRAGCQVVAPSPRTREVFGHLCRRGGARGNTVPDAWIAALTVTAGAELATADRGFARWPGLRWLHPLERPSH